MKLPYLIPILLLSACSTPRPSKVTVRPQEPPPAMDDSAVRYSEVLRAYHIGRYADPNHTRLMHESHTVYRVEVNSRWNLHPGANCSSAQDFATTSTNVAFSPPSLNDATLAELNLQKATTAQVMGQAKSLAASLEQLQAVLHQARLGVEETAAVRALVVTLEKRLQAMETEQRRLTQPLTVPQATESDTNSLAMPLLEK